MFNLNQNNQSSDPQGSRPANLGGSGTPANSRNFDNEKDFKVEDVPIYTMKNDIENPLSTQDEGAQKISFRKLNESEKGVLTDRQKTSPFLTQESSTPPTPLANNQMPSAIPASISVNNSERPRPAASLETKVSSPAAEINETKKTNWGRIMLSSIVILIIFIAGAGGYYFWITKKVISEPIATVEEPQEVTPTQEPEPIPEPEPEIPDTKKPAYFILDTANFDKTKLQAAVDKYFPQVTAAGANVSKEFVVVDPNNNPITFKSFASSAKLTLSAGILANVGDNFSLFLYNENGSAKIGLAVESKNDIGLKSAILKEEAMLAKELSPILLLSNYTTEKSFASSSYGGAEIRFQNLISPEKLSIDYTIYKNKLLIGTTKLTLRSIIDSLSTEQTD